MLSDYHIHSEFSNDSKEPVENIVKKAILLGLDEICFTEHVDYGVKTDYGEPPAHHHMLNVDYPNYFKAIKDLQKNYQSKITIKCGLEFGIQTHTIDKYQQLFDQSPLDFVILSCHQVENKEFWTHEFQAGKSQDEYNKLYYEEILKCIKVYKSYSVLGHLDGIQRYNETIHPFEKSKKMITLILKQIIQDEKGLEVNTSSFRYGLPDLTPSKEILRLYQAMGGRFLTIGSDCHKAGDLGEKILFIQNELIEMGYQYHCTFEKMVPQFHVLARCS